jgi:hypothetical protein
MGHVLLGGEVRASFEGEAIAEAGGDRDVGS